MGSRLMHTAIAAEVMKQERSWNQERFLYGSLLPDAAVNGNSHWRMHAPGGRQTYDLAGFRKTYAYSLCSDDLVLGYYLHLVSDMLMRRYLQERKGWCASWYRNKQLHHDYRVLNAVLVSRYDLAGVSGKLRAEETGDLSGMRFDGDALLQQVKQDLCGKDQGRTYFFGEEDAAEYITYAAELCRKEIEALQRGESVIDEMNISWEWGRAPVPVRAVRKAKRILRRFLQ